ncbi:hypothetical protein JHK87_043088 [Glycine soja]|nr:hypothetical protein JHK87_043088 [Glycine soja]
MKRSFSSGRFSLTRNGRGKQWVLPGVIVTGICYWLQVCTIETIGPVFTAMFTPLALIITAIFSALVERNTLLGKVQILLYQSQNKHKIVGGTVLLVVGLYNVLWEKSKESVKEGVKGHNLEVEETKEETRLECIVQH